MPVTALKASLGCGNPTALAELKPGEVVLDLGSGGGIDVLLSARRVGPTSDVVVRGRVPAEIKKNMELWVGCVAGALSDYEYVAKLAKAGFDNIDIEPTRVYSIEDARAFLSARGLDVDALAREVEGKFISAFVRASKPQRPAARPVAAPEVVL